MRARYERESAKRQRLINLLDRVRDKEFNAKQRWLRCRLHWFGDPELRRDEMEKELKRVLVDSQRVTEEYRKPHFEQPQQRYSGEYHVPIYQLGMEYSTADMNQDITAEFEAAADSVAAYRQPTVPVDTTPIAGFLQTYPDRDMSAPAHQIETSMNSTSAADAANKDSDLGFNPETSVLFEPYFPQHGPSGRRTTDEVNLFGTYKSMFAPEDLAIDRPSIKRSSEIEKRGAAEPAASFDASAAPTEPSEQTTGNFSPPVSNEIAPPTSTTAAETPLQQVATSDTASASP